MKRERADELLRRFRETPITVFGDLMLDRYIWGDAERISPEAPVPVVHAVRESSRLGGAGNVAANIQALGGRATPVGVIGEDASGETLVGLLKGIGVETAGVLTDADRRTTVKTRVIARNQQVVRVDFEADESISAELASRIGERLGRLVPESRALIISDYGKGIIDPRTLASALEVSRGAPVPVAVDPKETHFFDYRGVTVITPNTLEASGAVGRRLRTEEEVVAAGNELRERLQATSVLITRGEKGMSLFEAEEVTHFPTLAEEVYDVTGAGDTVVSSLALAHAAGATLKEAAEIATVAASLAVREVGTIAVKHDDLVTELIRRSES